MKKAFILLIIVFTITAASAQKKISAAMQYYNRGIVMIQKGNYTDAITVFNTAIQENPKLGIAYYQRGLAKLKENAKSTTNQYTDICADFKLAAKYGYKVPSKILKEANCSGK